ncbi:hypothetical protein GCM10010449_23400 [Streptomyces rectiviolaceus]|uniref:Uncharacterized protein n=1 Tax=Streptomyces rectiviolaceus TaxID=332591 RepID=A0ABP6MC31_9ACTN
MTDLIARLFGPFLRFLLPATGRHRGASAASCSRCEQPAFYIELAVTDVLDGEGNVIVRPYLVADELRLQRQRRRALWLAVHGVDVGPRIIHGMEVA